MDSADWNTVTKLSTFFSQNASSYSARTTSSNSAVDKIHNPIPNASAPACFQGVCHTARPTPMGNVTRNRRKLARSSKISSTGLHGLTRYESSVPLAARLWMSQAPTNSVETAEEISEKPIKAPSDWSVHPDSVRSSSIREAQNSHSAAQSIISSRTTNGPLAR